MVIFPSYFVVMPGFVGACGLRGQVGGFRLPRRPIDVEQGSVSSVTFIPPRRPTSSSAAPERGAQRDLRPLASMSVLNCISEHEAVVCCLPLAVFSRFPFLAEPARRILRPAVSASYPPRGVETPAFRGRMVTDGVVHRSLQTSFSCVSANGAPVSVRLAPSQLWSLWSPTTRPSRFEER